MVTLGGGDQPTDKPLVQLAGCQEDVKMGIGIGSGSLGGSSDAPLLLWLQLSLVLFVLRVLSLSLSPSSSSLNTSLCPSGKGERTTIKWVRGGGG
jgi:hypothetical protein